MATRVSKELKYNPNLKIEEFDVSKIDKNNVINYLLIMNRHDVSRTLLMKLFGSFDGESMIHQYDTFVVPAGGFSFKNSKGKMVSNKDPFTTTVGIWIFNIFLLRDFDFSDILGGYVNENITSKAFSKINQKLVYGLLEDKISVENYKIFLDYTQFLMPYETILSPNHSERMLSFTKEANKLKAKLIKENQEAIDKGDAAVAEMIENKLIEFALEYLKDDPALDVYLSGAGGNIPNNFKNMYLMKGAIRNPDPDAPQEFNIASSSFIDGISSDEYALLANSLAGGPYARAKKTELGGYWEKLISTAYSSTRMDEPGSDCGTKLGIEILLTESNLSMFMYSYIMKGDNNLEELTMENSSKYIGKRIKLRYAGFCKSKTGICHHCAGNFFNRRGNRNIGLATAQIPTVLKLRSMKSFHDSTISTTEIDPMRAFGLE
ncbi:MAG: hypothetical protein IKR19_07995 [Acholeplasmatales bacterium]|nr:hypothetical protein [Acholeplasmatales bacterium]